jgi:hypothetical protein
MPQHPKKLLDQVRVCPEPVEMIATPTVSTGGPGRPQPPGFSNFRGLTWPRIATASVPNWQQERVHTWRCSRP